MHIYTVHTQTAACRPRGDLVESRMHTLILTIERNIWRTIVSYKTVTQFHLDASKHRTIQDMLVKAQSKASQTFKSSLDDSDTLSDLPRAEKVIPPTLHAGRALPHCMLGGWLHYQQTGCHRHGSSFRQTLLLCKNRFQLQWLWSAHMIDRYKWQGCLAVQTHHNWFGWLTGISNKQMIDRYIIYNRQQLDSGLKKDYKYWCVLL